VKLIVSGAGGFIGGHVVRAALERGHRVVALVRRGSTRDRLAPLGDRVQVATPALEDPAEMAMLFREHEPDAAVHLAWYARPGDYLSSSENLDSLKSTLSFLDGALTNGCRRLVAVGTCLEYADSGELRDEPHPTDPKSLYASCKLAAWLAGRARARQFGASLAWARLFHVYGPNEHPGRLIPSVATALRAGQPFAASPGLQVRDPIHVADVASALVTLTECGEHGAYNVCLGKPVTLRGTLQTLADIERRPDLLRFGDRPYGAEEPMFLVGNPRRLRALGWEPRYEDLRAGLADTLSAPIRLQ
jgi:nucleoside-diphosphate-sugar epimerase